MLGRRDFLLAACGLLLGRNALALPLSAPGLDWPGFVAAMRRLAAELAGGDLTAEQAGEQGLGLLRELRTADPAFLAAVDASWESGNAYWLWQRLNKEADLNGGILTIERGHDVPLHDHPGATGMLRMLSGEAEVWQFNRPAGNASGEVELERVTRRVLRPGDTALLLPASGNIHGLRALSDRCSMLDYFIPPYRRAERAWYLPAEADWMERTRVHCRVVPEQEFTVA